MRKFLMILVTAFLGYASTRAQITNGSFEQWASDTIGYAPAGYDRWFTWGLYFPIFSPLPSNVGPTQADAIAGNYSMKLWTLSAGSDTIPGIMILRVDGYNLPAGTYPFTIHLNFTPQGADSAFVGAFVANAGKTFIGGLQKMVPATSGDTMITDSVVVAPLLGNATTLIVALISGENPLSTLIVDSIAFNGASLPNPGFEQWTPLVDQIPVGWFGAPAFPEMERDTFFLLPQDTQPFQWFIGDSLKYSLRQTTDAHAGSYAVRLTPRYDADQNFNPVDDTVAVVALGNHSVLTFSMLPLSMQPVSFTAPVQSLSFYYRSSAQSQDTMGLILRVKNANMDTTINEWLPPSAAYTQHTVMLPFAVAPDSLGLLFGIEGQPGSSWMHVDHVFINTTTGLRYAWMDDDVTVRYDGEALRLNAWPMQEKSLVLEVVNMTGQQVGQWRLRHGTQSVPWRMPARGVYFYTLHNDRGRLIKSGKLTMMR